MNDDVTVVRIYIKESDHGHKKSLMEELLNILQDQHQVHGVVVFRGIAGFGSKGAVHSADLLRLTVDLPLVVEFYDKPEVVDAALDLISDIVPAGHIIRWRATCRGFGPA
jgi:PII-like signaling protein